MSTWYGTSEDVLWAAHLGSGRRILVNSNMCVELQHDARELQQAVRAGVVKRSAPRIHT